MDILTAGNSSQQPLLSPITSERLEEIEHEANTFRRKLNLDGKHLLPKKRWADVKIRVIPTNGSGEHNSEQSSDASSSTSQPPVMSSGMPKNFVVDEYEFTDIDNSSVNSSSNTRLKPLSIRPDSGLNNSSSHSTQNHDSQQGSAKAGHLGSLPIPDSQATPNGIITPVHQRKSFKKQLAMDWENRVSH